jgi:putative membrane protein
MLLALSLHIAFLSLWSATLVYLPQLFLRQAMAEDPDIRLQLEHMQRWLYAYVMTPSALLTVAFGIGLVFERNFEGGWLPVKLAFVLLMGLFHGYCGHVMVNLQRRRAMHRPLYYRVLPVAPALLILAVVTLVAAKPF